MSESETWRVVLVGGEVREVVLRWGRDSWEASSERWWIRNGDPAWCVAEFARAEFAGLPVEILAPGVSSRAELEAQRDMALAALALRQADCDARDVSLAAVTAQRDRAVESVARLRRDVEHEIVRRDIAEAERDEAQAQRDEAREALATARREGAEEMRAAAVRLLDACGSPRVKLTIDDAVYAVNFAAAGLTVDERRKVTS